jgi:hypothetical protein
MSNIQNSGNPIELVKPASEASIDFSKYLKSQAVTEKSNNKPKNNLLSKFDLNSVKKAPTIGNQS